MFSPALKKKHRGKNSAFGKGKSSVPVSAEQGVSSIFLPKGDKLKVPLPSNLTRSFAHPTCPEMPPGPAQLLWALCTTKVTSVFPPSQGQTFQAENPLSLSQSIPSADQNLHQHQGTRSCLLSRFHQENDLKSHSPGSAFLLLHFMGILCLQQGEAQPWVPHVSLFSRVHPSCRFSWSQPGLIPTSGNELPAPLLSLPALNKFDLLIDLNFGQH